MKRHPRENISSFRVALRTAARAARRKAFRKGFPIAISKNGKVFFVFKDNREVPLSKSRKINAK